MSPTPASPLPPEQPASAQPPAPSAESRPTGAPVHVLTRDAMACTFTLHLAGVAERYAQQAAAAAFVELERIELLLSRFVPHSDVAQLNALPPRKWLRVSADTLACLRVAAEAYELTVGAFNVCYRSAPPDKDTGPRSKRRTDADAGPQDKHNADANADPPLPPLACDPAASSVCTTRAGVVVDLGAVGKGYALDCMADVLREWRVPAALLSSGQSTALALGPPANEPAWRVALRDPQDAAAVRGHVELRNEALSGSGQVLHGGHIVDPRTGQVVTHHAAAWSVAPTATWADALSTAFMVLTAVEVTEVCTRRPEFAAVLCLSERKAGELAYVGARWPAAD